MQVVDDLAADVDGRPVQGEGTLDDLDRPVDTGAERPGRGQQHLVLAAGACPAFERPAHREQRPERSGAAEHRPPLARVRDRADDSERVVLGRISP